MLTVPEVGEGDPALVDGLHQRRLDDEQDAAVPGKRMRPAMAHLVGIGVQAGQHTGCSTIGGDNRQGIRVAGGEDDPVVLGPGAAFGER